jgi:glycosyltransferase involved in cell wall biosynthesis
MRGVFFDVALCAVITCLGFALLVPYGLVLRRVRRRTKSPRIVYLGTGRIAQVFPRNGANLFLERECSDFDGYFEQLWNVHFPAAGRGSLDLTPRHHLVDIDFATPKRVGKRTAMALREIAFLFWLLRFLVHTRASVVTATNPYLQGLHAALAARLLGMPYAVIITRDFDWDWSVLRKQAFASVFPSRMVERAVGRRVLRHAHLVLADREYYRQFAVRNGASPERAVATRVLADEAYAQARPSQDVRARLGVADGPLLLYVGRLDADKFVFDLVECLAHVRRHDARVQLACAGRGALEDAMQRRAADLGVSDGLHLLGALELDDLATLVASSDLVVAPHMGYTLIEAGLTGTPIVTYDYDFAPEVIVDGVSGCLVPLRDVRALAERVCSLLAEPACARAMGQRLRDRLLREHSREAVVPLYRAAYERVLRELREHRELRELREVNR